MHPAMMSTLLLTLSLILAPSAGVCRANESVTLALRSAAEIGPQITATTGPDGQPAIELTGPSITGGWIGPTVAGGAMDAERSDLLKSFYNPLLTLNAPPFAASNYLLRGRMKCDGVVGDAQLNLSSNLQHESCQIPGQRFTGTSDWQDFELTVLHVLDGLAGMAEDAPAEKARQLKITALLPGAGKVTLAGPFVIAPVTLSSERKWQAQQPILTLPSSAIDIGPRAVTAQGPKGEPALAVTGGNAPWIFTLALSENPGITSPTYALRGRVKYDGAAADSTLELLSDFGENRIFFSREKFSGSSDWHDFELRFHAKPGMTLQRVGLNVGLPRGTVTLAEPLVLAPLDLSGAWWTDQQAGTIGGVLGCLGGLLGTLIGVSAGCRRFTLSKIFCGVGLAAGAVSLIAGVVAVSLGQPWHVWYPLLLTGFVGTMVCGPLLVLGFRLSQADELRRMTGLDAI